MFDRSHILAAVLFLLIIIGMVSYVVLETHERKGDTAPVVDEITSEVNRIE